VLKRTFFGVMTAVAMWSVTVPSHAAPAWQDVGDINGVHVWKRDEPGSGVTSFRGEMVAPVHIGKLIAVMQDRDQRKNWVDRFHSSTLIEKPGPFSEIYWIRFKLPAVISDRDYVLRADGAADDANHVFTIEIKSVNDPRKGPDDCCTRAVINRAFYKFTALKAVNGVPQTKIEVEVNTDPKGLLPNWLVNMIQKEWPSKTLNNLVRYTKSSNAQPLPQLASWHD
jgi:hypothetical protein